VATGYPKGPFGHYASEKQLRDDLDRAYDYARTPGVLASLHAV
jgi:hypothetical protein